jgi:chromosome segregation ATPase
MKYYDQEVNSLKMQLKGYEEKVMQLSQDINCRDDQIIAYKSELQSVQDKYKTKFEDAAKLETEVSNLSQKCAYLADEVKKLELCLDKSRDNGERLHKESEMVISNVNSWVNEQRSNNEKLSAKIREQSAVMAHLTNERDKLAHENELYQQKIRKMTQDVENAAFDKEKIKALQNHLNQQQMLLHQLQGRLKDYE